MGRIGLTVVKTQVFGICLLVDGRWETIGELEAICASIVSRILNLGTKSGDPRPQATVCPVRSTCSLNAECRVVEPELKVCQCRIETRTRRGGFGACLL